MVIKRVLKNSALCIVTVVAGISGYTLAADTTLNIIGVVKASPCTVDADDTSGNISVDLGSNIQAASLAASTGSAWKQFDLKLKDCPTTTTSVTVTFTGTPATESGASDMYKNTGDATKVQIELQDRIANTRKGNTSTMTATVATATRDAVFPLQARAYSIEGGVTPGDIVGTIQVSFIYQ